MSETVISLQYSVKTVDKADKAIVLIKAEYDFNEMPVNDKTVFEWMLKADSTANVARTTGDIAAGREQSDTVVESEYHDVYLAHAPMETHTALAKFEGDKLTVWAATQSPFGLQDGLVSELGMKRENVRVIAPLVGGGFGGKKRLSAGYRSSKTC